MFRMYGGGGRASAWLVGWAVLVVAASGCGDPDPTGPDATPTDASTASEFAAPPRIPWLTVGDPPVAPPAFACPPGWRTDADASGSTWCEPFAEADPPDCPMGRGRFPGSSDCEHIGPVCPSDGLPDALPADRPAVFVLAGATGGDGSRALPHGSTTDFSWGGLAAETIVALGRGRYEVELRIPGRIGVWGACVEETTLTTTVASDTQGVVSPAGPDVELRALSIADAPRPAVWIAGAGRSVRLDGVWVEGAELAALLVARDATLEARDVVVVDTRSRSRDRVAGRAMSIQLGGTADVVRGIFLRNHDAAIHSSEDGTTVQLSDVVASDTLAQARDSAFGRGLSAVRGASIDVVRSVFERNLSRGLYVEDASVRVSDSVIRDTAGQRSDGTLGEGLGVRGAGAATAERTMFERNRGAGVVAGEVGATVSLTDVIVRDTLSRAVDLGFGRGISVENGASVSVDRAALERNRQLGAYLSGIGTTASLVDVVVRDTQSQENDRAGGRGVTVQMAATAGIARTIVERNRDAGILVFGEGTMATLTDVAVRDTLPRESDDQFGIGLVGEMGATTEADRLAVERNTTIGIYQTNDGTTLNARDVVVRDTRSRATDGFGGRGLNVELGPAVDVTRAVFERNRQVSVLSGGPGASLRATDIVVDDTLPHECFDDGRCPDQPFGMGLGAYHDASATIERFSLRRANLCGVQVDFDGQLDISRGEVAESAIGACIQTVGYDFERLTSDVAFRDNGVNLETTSLPVPEAADPLGL